MWGNQILDCPFYRKTSLFAISSDYTATHSVILASPSHKFGTKPEEMLVTEIMVSMASYQREANKEQVKNRQHARMFNGYWVFHPPPGYKYVKDALAGKVMARDPHKADAIALALEGFATGRFEGQADVANFLSQSGAFGKTFHATRVKAVLTNVLYTGYLEYPRWAVTLREGKHPALIDMQTFDRIQERLGLKAKAPYRKDLSADFPLRGFLLCAACHEPMTAAWSTGRMSKHPYYRCKNTACHLCGKSISRERVEEEFKDVLREMAPSKSFLELAKAVVEDCWRRKRGEHNSHLADLDRKKKEADRIVARLTTRLLEIEDRDLIEIYEKQLKAQELHRKLLGAQAAQVYQIDTSFESALGTVLDFIGNPLSLWENGDLDDKRLVLKLAFAKKVSFDKENGFGTALTSLPFTVFREFSTGKKEMVVYLGYCF